MSRRSHPVDGVLPLFEMALQIEQAKMAQINARIAQLTQQLKDLDRPHHVDQNALSPARRAGADMRWNTWAEARRGLLRQEIAKAMAQRADHAQVLTRALAKKEAARSLSKKMRVQRQKTIARRASLHDEL
ncbi:MAG: hypothetical protein AAGL89_05595 [Pseudomonadota bacterium]